jgi:hypothetical protein
MAAQRMKIGRAASLLCCSGAKPALLFWCKVKFLDREPYRLLVGGLPQKHEAPATQAHKRDRAAKLGQERP